MGERPLSPGEIGERYSRKEIRKKFSEKKREDWLGFLVMVSLAFLAYHVGTVQQKRRERWAKNVARVGGRYLPKGSYDYTCLFSSVLL